MNSIYSTFTSSAKQADSVSKVTPVKKVTPVDSNAAAIYVKSSEEPEKKATYSVNKMSKEDRSAYYHILKFCDDKSSINKYQ